MKKITLVLSSFFVLAAANPALAQYTAPPYLGIPLHCQGFLTAPAGYPAYTGQVALYFTDSKATSATLWHQYENGTSRFYSMKCYSQYVGDGPSGFVCEEQSSDALKFGVYISGDYRSQSGLSNQGGVNIERDGNYEHLEFVASAGSISCN